MYRPGTRLLILVLLMAVLTGCRTSPAGQSQGAPAAPPAAAESLALRPTAGEEITYHTVVNTAFEGRSLNGQAIPGGRQLTGKTALQYDAHLRFENVAAGEATIAYKLTGFQIKTEVGGQEQPAGTGAPGDLAFTMKVDIATGKLKEIDLGPELKGLVNQEQFRKMLEQTFVRLPDGGQVKPGNHWTVDTPLPVDVPGIKIDSNISVTTTYEADETRNGLKAAKLVTTGGGPVTMTGEAESVSFTVKGTLEMHGVQYVDLRTGLPLSVESSTTLKFTQSMKELKSGLSTEIEMESTSEIAMVRK